MRIGNTALPDGILDGLLQFPDFTAGLEVEGLHDFLARDGIGPGAVVVTLLEVLEFLTHKAEIVEETLLLLPVLARDVGFTERHEVIDVLPGLEEQTAHGTVRHLLIGNDDGAHVQTDKFLDVLHPVIKRQFEVAEDGRHHLFPNEVMVVERPPHPRFPAFAARFANVMEQGSPTQVERSTGTHHVLQHLQRMVEVILVGTPVHRLHPFHRCQFGEDEGEESAAGEFDESLAGMRSHHDLVEFVYDAFARDDADALTVALQRSKGLLVNLEIELCGKAYGTHHAQGVVRESDVRIQRRAYEPVLHVVQSVEAVNELAVTVTVETDGQGIDGQVAAVEVILQRAILHDGLAGVMAVALTACPHELHLGESLLVLPLLRSEGSLDLCRPEIAEDAEPCLAMIALEMVDECLGHSNARGILRMSLRGHYDDIDILGGTLQEDVTHITAHHVSLQSQTIGCIADEVEDGVAVQVQGQFFVGKISIHVGDCLLLVMLQLALEELRLQGEAFVLGGIAGQGRVHAFGQSRETVLSGQHLHAVHQQNGLLACLNGKGTGTAERLDGVAGSIVTACLAKGAGFGKQDTALCSLGVTGFLTGIFAAHKEQEDEEETPQPTSKEGGFLRLIQQHVMRNVRRLVTRTCCAQDCIRSQGSRGSSPAPRG